MRRKPVIVGIDPGTTTAIAFLNAYGEPIEVKSSKKYSKKSVIQEIRKHGSPMVLGTDKSTLPSSLQEIVTKFHCKVSVPKQDLSKEDKRDLVRPYKHLVDNNHEKDALAAALQSHKAYSKQLRKIRRRNPDRYEKVVRRELLGLGIEKAKEKRMERPKGQDLRKYQKEIKSLRKKIERLQENLEDKEEYIEELQRDINELKKEETGGERAYLESKIRKNKREKKKLKERLRELSKAFSEGSLKMMDEEQMRRKRYTESKERYEDLKRKGEEAHLVKIIFETPSKIYYTEKDHCEAKGNIVHKVLEKYRRNRGSK